MLPSDVIRERGWHQGGLTSGRTGGVCALGAIAVAFGIDMQDGEYSELMQEDRAGLFTARLAYLIDPDTDGEAVDTVYHWNDGLLEDHTDIGEVDVLAALKRVEQPIENPVPWAEKGLALIEVKHATL